MKRLETLSCTPHYQPWNYKAQYKWFCWFKCLWIIFAIPLFANNLSEEEFRSGTVIPNTLHVRAKPGEKYEVVCRLIHGDEVKIKKNYQNWFAIVAPKQAEAWVALNHIDGSEIIDENVPVYAGPGTIFSSFHKLNQGEKITIDRISNDQWAKIKPLDDFILWVHRDYIEVISENADNDIQAAADEKSGAPEKELVAESSLKPPIDSESESNRQTSHKEKQLIHAIIPRPIDRNIVSIGEKEKIQKTGTIVLLDETSDPFQYALAKKINSTFYPLAYLSPEYDKLEEWEGKKVVLSGFQSWIRGWPRPMIEIETIVPVENAK